MDLYLLAELKTISLKVKFEIAHKVEHLKLPAR